MPYAENKGVRIFYEVAGEGPAMVLIHANPFDHKLWAYQITRFSNRFRIVAPDLRGYGRSDKIATPFTLDDLADDIVAVCAHAGIERTIVGGISVGSGMALALALDHPDLVRALILVGGASSRPAAYDARIAGYEGPGFPAYRREHMEECFAPGFAATPHGRYLVEGFLESDPLLDGKAIAEVFRARGGADLRPRLPSLRLPVLVVNGAHDMSLKPGRETASLIPGAEQVTLNNTGHCCNIEDPAAFDAVVIAFLLKHGLWKEMT
ncbi:MAG: alpha/beta fold hydrolase [Rhizobiales bacterium]|nr:alpha/beta fold hydrolase [Hyphomicrobiales bacterium]